MSKVRTRFAPSPTGALHIGGVRTALYNYLFAKQHKGECILRIEDTDQSRFVGSAEEYIKRSFEWCGISFDESPEKGGNYAPYKQSERKDIYKKYIQQLLDENKAYYAFDTPKELEEMRNRLQEAKSSVQHYNYVTRDKMKNSFTLTADEVRRRIEGKEPYVIRFNMPKDQTVEMQDIIRGNIKVYTKELDDKVLFKSDGLPTYHLANVVDDHLMEISHVIRGEEWLPSLPLHVLLYKALGWEDTMPQFAHLPLLLNPDGIGKLSKRNAAKHGFPVFPLAWRNSPQEEYIKGYRESEYFPEAFINLLATLSWNDGTDQEIFSMEELIEKFDLKRVSKAGVRFSIDKAKWFNKQYMQMKSTEEIIAYMHSAYSSAVASLGDPHYETLSKIIPLVKNKATFCFDFFKEGLYFYSRPEKFDEKTLKEVCSKESIGMLKDFVEQLKQGKKDMSVFKDLYEGYAHVIKFGKAMASLRLALTGRLKGVGLFDIIEIIGIDEAVKRIEYYIEQIEK